MVYLGMSWAEGKYQLKLQNPFCKHRTQKIFENQRTEKGGAWVAQ